VSARALSGASAASPRALRGLARHRLELADGVAILGHLAGDDQMGLVIDGGPDVLAYRRLAVLVEQARASAGQADLPDPALEAGLELAAALADPFELGAEGLAASAVDGLKLVKVMLGGRVDLLDKLAELPPRCSSWCCCWPP